jgi:hypothetical protein
MIIRIIKHVGFISSLITLASFRPPQSNIESFFYGILLGFVFYHYSQRFYPIYFCPKHFLKLKFVHKEPRYFYEGPGKSDTHCYYAYYCSFCCFKKSILVQNAFAFKDWNTELKKRDEFLKNYKSSFGLFK